MTTYHGVFIVSDEEAHVVDLPGETWIDACSYADSVTNTGVFAFAGTQENLRTYVEVCEKQGKKSILIEAVKEFLARTSNNLTTVPSV